MGPDSSIFALLASLFFVILPLIYLSPTLNFRTDCADHVGLVGAEDEQLKKAIFQSIDRGTGSGCDAEFIIDMGDMPLHSLR